jgi:MFS family permease
MSKSNKTQFNTKIVIWIGLAFFTAEISWALYNAYVPDLLRSYVPDPKSGALILQLGIVGLLMALDNMVGVILQPITGNLSDKTRTRFGRRTPYLIIGIPLAAFFFALIPFEINFFTLILWMFLFSVSMGLYRAPAVSLMPDFVRPVNRSKGNAIINVFGGVGAAIGYAMNFLTKAITPQGSFIIVSVLMLVGLLVLLLKVKEDESYSYQLILELEEGGKELEEEEKPGLISSLKYIIKEKDKSTLLICLAIFCWFVAYQGIVALLTIFGMDILNLDRSTAGFLGFFVAGSLIVFAYPLSTLAPKIGRRLCIKIGLVIMISALIAGSFLLFLGGITATIAIIIVLIIGGFAWALINVNSIVIVWELAPSKEKMGVYTGVYYLFAYMAAIFGPFILGSLTDLTSPPGQPWTMLLNAAVFFGIALVLMFGVKRGEAELTDEMRLEAQKAM